MNDERGNKGQAANSEVDGQRNEDPVQATTRVQTSVLAFVVVALMLAVLVLGAVRMVIVDGALVVVVVSVVSDTAVDAAVTAVKSLVVVAKPTVVAGDLATAADNTRAMAGIERVNHHVANWQWREARGLAIAVAAATSEPTPPKIRGPTATWSTWSSCPETMPKFRAAKMPLPFLS